MLQGKRILGKLKENKISLVLIRSRIFTLRKGWTDEARKYCSMYIWGGKSEQESLASKMLDIQAG